MAGSIFSLVSLAILITASYCANMSQLQTSTTQSSTIPDVYTTETDNITREQTSEEPNFVTSSYLNSDENRCPESITLNESLLNCSLVSNSSQVTRNTTDPAFTGEMSWQEYPEGKIFVAIQAVDYHITNIPGMITNPLCILVAFYSKSLQTSELYIAMLGVSDFCVVVVRYSIRSLESNYAKRHDWDCKFLHVTGSLFLVFSNLIVLVWTIERLIAVMFPLKLSSWCSLKNTKIALCVTFCVSVGITMPYITISVVVTYSDGVILYFCQYSKFSFEVWSHVESVVYVYIPMLVICTSNCIIGWKLKQISAVRQQMSSSEETIKKRENEQRKMTIVLMTISISFCVLHIPYILVLVWFYLYPDVYEIYYNDQRDFAKYILYTRLGMLIAEFHNSLNFFLYCISGSKFRKMFMSIFCKCKHRQD
jgi:hypothetical protein